MPRSSIIQCKTYMDEVKEDFSKLWHKPLKPKGKVSDFSRIKIIGTGYFGRVMLVFDTKHNEYFAMKILDNKRLCGNMNHKMNEIKVLRATRFPFLIHLEFYLKDDKFTYLVLPYSNGIGMFYCLNDELKFKDNVARFFAAQVVLALEYLQSVRVIHRDIKPENILIEANGYIKIVDFGFCKRIQHRTWSFCGTPEYMAPEIILNKGHSKAVDWWSLGVLIYEMLTGNTPFYSNDIMKIYDNVLLGRYRCPSFVGKDAKNLIFKLLQVDPTRRYGNLKNGPIDVQEHKWFKHTDWMSVLNCKQKAPYVPKLKSQ